MDKPPKPLAYYDPSYLKILLFWRGAHSARPLSRAVE